MGRRPRKSDRKAHREIIREHFRRDGRAKHAFDSKRSARSFANAHPKDHYSVYECGFCNEWHIGHARKHK